VPVAGGDAEAVVDIDGIAVGAVAAGGSDGAGSGGVDSEPMPPGATRSRPEWKPGGR